MQVFDYADPFVAIDEKVNLLPPSVRDLQFGRFLKNGNAIN